jgi:hypothetical protein
MKTDFTKKELAAFDVADDIYEHLARVNVKSYEAAGLQVLWLPWKDEVIVLADTKAISHALVMTGLMDAKVPMRKFVVNEVINIYRSEIISSRRTPPEVKEKARALRASYKERKDI